MVESQVLLANDGSEAKQEVEEITPDNIELIFGYVNIILSLVKVLKLWKSFKIGYN
jgi:hypothetical protein